MVNIELTGMARPMIGQEAFSDAVTAHASAMFRAARALLDCDADAEDAVAEALLRAWQNYGSLKRPEAMRAWLIKITVNCAYNQRRKAGRVIYTGDLASVAGSAEPPPVTGLWDAVLALPEDQRAAVVLFYYEDMRIAEIAKTLAVAQGTVKSRLSRARNRLGELLKEEE